MKKFGKQNGIQFRTSPWDSRILLKNVKPDDIYVTDEVRKIIHAPMWRNITSEYDGIHLSQYLRDNAYRYSKELMDFEHFWLLEETNHYIGLRQIYSSIFRKDPKDVHAKISARKPDYSDFETILEDEFELCLNFAYVELVGARGYVGAFPVYDSFRVPELKRWIRLAARDELYHCLNIISILRTVHSSRLHEITESLKKIVLREFGRSNEYRGTFMFDHDPPVDDTSASFLKKCANDVCRYLSIQQPFND